MNDMAQKVVEWLRSLPNITKARPVRVTLGRVCPRFWYGARYTTTLKYEAGMMACTHHGVKPGTPYSDDGIYLVGAPPGKEGTKLCFPFEGLDWYISGYYLGNAVTEYQPFGSHFMLRPWNVPDGSMIDQYEVRPYKRIAMSVTEL